MCIAPVLALALSGQLALLLKTSPCTTHPHALSPRVRRILFSSLRFYNTSSLHRRRDPSVLHLTPYATRNYGTVATACLLLRPPTLRCAAAEARAAEMAIDRHHHKWNNLFMKYLVVFLVGTVMTKAAVATATGAATCYYPDGTRATDYQYVPDPNATTGTCNIPPRFVYSLANAVVVHQRMAVPSTRAAVIQ